MTHGVVSLMGNEFFMSVLVHSPANGCAGSECFNFTSTNVFRIFVVVATSCLVTKFRTGSSPISLVRILSRSTLCVSLRVARHGSTKFQFLRAFWKNLFELLILRISALLPSQLTDSIKTELYIFHRCFSFS